jgi:hypothetical protein
MLSLTTALVLVQRERYLQLRDELASHCEKAGLGPLPPPDFSLPLALRV